MGREIIIYSDDRCYYCKKAKIYLEELGVRFIEINIKKYPEKYKEMIRKTGVKGVPQLAIGEDWVVGFNPELIRKKIERA